MKFFTTEIKPAKNQTQEVTFLVEQFGAYPDINGYSGNFRWRNGNGIFPEYGRPPEGIRENYKAYLIRSDLKPKDFPKEWNRTHLAGYEGNPGAITFRGKSLGEMFLEVTNYVEIKVRGNDRPTETERSFIGTEIALGLKAFIEANKKALRADAIKAIEERLKEEISDMKKALYRLDEEAKAAIKNLKEKK